MRRVVTAALGMILLVGGTNVSAAEDAGLRSVFARGAGERALALGGAYGALADDAVSPFWNPAGLGHVERLSFQVAHTDLIGMGFYEQYGVVALPSWRFGTVAVALRRFGTDGIEGRDDGGGLTGTDLDDAESELAFSYGRRLGTGWTVGATVKYQQQSVAGYKGGGAGLDVGVQARPFVASGADSDVLRSVRLGLALRNIVEPNVNLLDEDVPDPFGLRFGAAVTVPIGAKAALTAAADLEKTRDMDPHAHAGAELRLLDLLALRVGGNDGTLAAGAGLRWRDLSVDYAFEDNTLASVHRVGLGVAFGPTTDQKRHEAQAAVERELQARLERAFEEDAEQREKDLVAATLAALMRDRPDEARRQVAALRVLAPAHPDADRLEARALMMQAAVAEEADDLAGAALAFQQCLHVAPGHDGARAGLARVNAESDRRSARSAELRALYDEGMAAYAAGDLDAARASFTSITELAEGEDDAIRMLVHIDEAIRTRDRVETARARAARAAATRPAPGNPAPAASVAASTATENRAEPTPVPAPPSYEDLSLERRAEITDLYQRGSQAAEQGRRFEAMRYWEMVWEAAPDYRQVADHLTQEYLAQGMEAFAEGRLEDAIGLWEKARRVAPDDARVQGYLGRAYEHRARLRERGNGR